MNTYHVMARREHAPDWSGIRLKVVADDAPPADLPRAVADMIHEPDTLVTTHARGTVKAANYRWPPYVTRRQDALERAVDGRGGWVDVTDCVDVEAWRVLVKGELAS